MIEEIENLKDIDGLIRQKQAFAVYRLPGEQVAHLVTQGRGEVCLLDNLEGLNGRKGFVIAPFRVSERCPVVLLCPGEEERLLEVDWDSVEEWAAVQRSQGKETLQEVCTDAYAACFRTFIEALQEKQFDKLVLSRRQVVGREADFSPLRVFAEACKRYIHSYVYLCYTPHTGMWLGSTPEIILSGQGQQWHTVALAGTQPLQEGRLPVAWDEKNREEQAYVASYIRSRLHSLGLQTTENGPYAAYAGALSHLKTDFWFSLADKGSLGSLLKLLHPTPAVCGLPKEEAYRFIVEKEGYDRSYYAGFVGWMNPADRTDLYVNLRCMQMGDRELSFYAGGGLLASSCLHDEWMETEKKLQTMKRLALPVPALSAHD